MKRLERSAGLERGIDPGRLVLVAAGFAAAGGLIGAAAGPCESNEFLGCIASPTTREGAIQLGAAIGLALGIPVGWVSSRTEREVWRPVAGFGAGGGSLEIRPFVGPRSGLAVSFRPGRR